MSLLGDVRGRAAAVVLGALVCQLGLGFGYTLGALMPPILEEFGWSRAQWSAARLPQLALMSLASAPVGVLAARWGSRRVLLGSVVALGVTFGLLSRMQGLASYYALVGVMGLALVGVGDIAAGQAVMNWVERGRGLALGLVYTGSNLGGWIFIRLAARLAEQGGWRQAFVGLALVALVGMLPVAALTVRERPAPATGADAPPGAAIDEPDALGLRAAARTPTFWILFFSLFTFFFYFLGMLDHFVAFLTDSGMTLAEAGAKFSNAVGLGMASKVAFGLVADRLAPKTAVLVDYGLLAASSLLLLALPAEPFLAVYVATWGFAAAARDVVTPLIVSHCFGARTMAEVYGGLMFTLVLGGVAGPLFAGAVHDRLGTYDVAFATFAVLNVAAVVALLFVRDERPRRLAA